MARREFPHLKGLIEVEREVDIAGNSLGRKPSPVAVFDAIGRATDLAPTCHFVTASYRNAKGLFARRVGLPAPGDHFLLSVLLEACHTKPAEPVPVE
jgi:hypothetical protein